MPYLKYAGQYVTSGGQYTLGVIPPPEEVTIGTQIWKTRNVDDNISLSKVYDDNESNRAIYGGLYLWSMVADIEAANPGWHVPTDAEWTTLTDYLGGVTLAAGPLKEAGTDHWDATNVADNSSGFTLLGGGYRTATVYNGLRVASYMMTADEYTPSPASFIWYRGFQNTTTFVTRGGQFKTYYYSVRLIKD